MEAEIKDKSGSIFSIAEKTQPVPGCTISESVYEAKGYHLLRFALATGTDISAESYLTPKLLFVHQGSLVLTTKAQDWTLRKGDAFILPIHTPIGMKAAGKSGCIYSELALKEDSTMNQAVKSGTIFQFKDLLPYREGQIINMDLVNDEKVKLVLMSFGEGTGLSEHAAPGEALLLALDGHGIIGYEGKEHKISAGESFKFDKNGRHYVKADGPFKMVLFLTLE